jgi:hypothetical protein
LEYTDVKHGQQGPPDKSRKVVLFGKYVSRADRGDYENIQTQCVKDVKAVQGEEDR